ANSVGGAIAVLVAVYGDAPAWNDRLRTALAQLIACDERLLGRGLFPGDGSEAEPAGYESFAMEGLSSAAAALHSLGIRPRGTRRMMESFWWSDYAMVTPEIVLDTGDFDGALGALPGYAWGAENGRDPYLRAFYGRATDPRLAGLSRVENTGRLLEMAPGQLDLVCCTRPEISLPPPPPPSRIFPKRGSAVLRSGWSPSDTVISLRAGPWFNHEHHDEGSFQVAAFGERLISEGGYANYYADPYYQNYFTQAPAHNVVLIDSDPFSQGAYDGKYWAAFSATPSITDHVLSPNIDYLAADLAPAYDGRISRYRREYLFLKPDLLIVHDRIEAPEAHRFTWLLHLPAGDEPSVEGAQAVIQGKAGAAVVTAAGENAPWALRATPLPISDYTELDHARVLPEQELRLSSTHRNAVSFLVSVRLVKRGNPRGSVEPASAPGAEGLRGNFGGTSFAAAFRNGNGNLRAGDASTDGRALASLERGSDQDVFASEMKSLSVNGEVWLAAGAPVDAVIRRTSSGIRVEFSNAVAVAVRIRSQQAPARTMLDGKPVSGAIEGGFVVLRDVPPGDHRVSITY
ncbi:MAG: heparinase II/III domain-containing protein, partial [Terriglobia bacterium]